jgi:hypothetical protein
MDVDAIIGGGGGGNDGPKEPESDEIKIASN